MASAILAGAVVGGLLGSAVPGKHVPMTVAAVSLGAAAVTAAGLTRPSATIWRVPRRPFFFRRREGVGIVFGTALGSGFLTELASFGVIPLITWCAARGSPLDGALAFAVFGAGRSLPIAAEAWRSVTYATYAGVETMWSRLSPKLRTVEAAVLVLLAWELLG